MARAKSVILTPAEKKAVSVTLKNDIKAAKASVASITSVRKDIDKAFAAASKAHLAALKDNDKLAAVANKALAGLTAQLATLTAPVAATA